MFLKIYYSQYVACIAHQQTHEFSAFIYVMMNYSSFHNWGIQYGACDLSL